MRTLIAVALVLAAGSSEAAVLCQKPSGVVVVRDACKKKESPLDLAQVGVTGASDAFITGPLPADVNLVASDTTLRRLSLPSGRYVVTIASDVAGEVEFACDTFTTTKFKSESIQAFPLPMVAIKVGELIPQ